ncbi:MAG TPA: hypothetical protein VG651_12770 [Stellaceae bacterium]|nr:hypothetical protein [Stellaceae bacterium]
MQAATEARKRERGDLRRIPLSMRISPTMRDEIETRAKVNARSLTAEAEILLEQALRTGEAFGTPWQRAMDVFAAMLQTERVMRLANPAETAPLDDPSAYAAAMIHAIEVLAAAAPIGTDIAVVLAGALEQVQGAKQ